MKVMSLWRRAGWLAATGLVTIGCAHARTPQADAPPPPTASPATPAIPAATAPAITPAPVSTPALITAPALAKSSAMPPGSGPDAAALTPPASAPAAADFAHDVRPILEKRCQPCHFAGGKMYERLPFDRAETIQRLGERLFTRIKAEDEQAVIRRFLAQGS
jgi:hypothetical protein